MKKSKKVQQQELLAYARAMATIAQKLKDSRVKAGLTQFEAAEKMEIHRNSLLHYEKGRLVPNARLIDKFAQLYGVDADWLAQGEDGPIPAVSNAFLDKYELLTDSQKRIVAQIVDEFLKVDGNEMTE